MARLWIEEFDAQSAAGWDTTNGTIGYDTTTPRRGAASLTCAPGTAVAASIAKACYPEDDAAAHVFLRAYVRVNTAPSARTAILAWSENPSDPTGFACIKLNPDRTLIVGGSGATTGTASAALTIGQWYRVEMEFDDTTDVVTAYLDGVQWATASVPLGGGSYARAGIIQPATADVDFDDIAVNDATGTSDNGLPGDEPITPAAPNFSTIVDDFNDGTVNGEVWSASYNPPDGYTETGGRARVVCGLDYNAFATAAAYTLTGSSLHVQVFPAAAGAAVAEAWTQVLIMSATAGTDLVMEVDAVAGEINMAVRVDYWDDAAVRITYDPVAHAWFRIRETGGTLYWETAPDGETWTTQRTATTPAWAADADLALQLISHRDAGTPNYAEFDNVNYLPTGQTGQEAFLSPAGDTGDARPLTATKAAVLGAARESSPARPVTAAKAAPVGAATAVDAAGPLTGSRTAGLAAAHTTTTARTLTGGKQLPLGTAHEAATGQPVGHTRTAALGPAGEETSARPVGTAKRVSLGSAATAGRAILLTSAKRGLLAAAHEETRAGAYTTAGAVRVHTAVTLDGARTVAVGKQAGIGAGRAADAARMVVGGKTIVLGTAHTGARARAFVVGVPTVLGTAATVEAARALAAGKTVLLAGAREQASGRPVGASKHLTLGPARDTSDARPVVVRVEGGITTARARNIAHPYTVAKRLILGSARETTAVEPLTAGHRAPFDRAAGRERAGSLTGGKTIRLGSARCTSGASALTVSSRTRLGTARTADRAGRVRQPFQTRRLRTAHSTDQAGTVTGLKQRPADRLTPSVSGPLLTSSTAGPSLTASTVGPELAATSSGGG